MLLCICIKWFLNTPGGKLFPRLLCDNKSFPDYYMLIIAKSGMNKVINFHSWFVHSPKLKTWNLKTLRHVNELLESFCWRNNYTLQKLHFKNYFVVHFSSKPFISKINCHQQLRNEFSYCQINIILPALVFVYLYYKIWKIWQKYFKSFFS